MAKLLQNYQIVFGYSFVDYDKLVKRNLDRSYKSLKKYIQDENKSTKAPNMNANIFKPKVNNIIKNLKILNKNIINKNKCGSHRNVLLWRS